WYPSGADFSPDGTKIVYTENTPGHTQVTVEGRTNPIAETERRVGTHGTGCLVTRRNADRLRPFHDGRRRDRRSHPGVRATDVTHRRRGRPRLGATDDRGPGTRLRRRPGRPRLRRGHRLARRVGDHPGLQPTRQHPLLPNDYVTRGQMAAFLHRALGDRGPTAGPGLRLRASTSPRGDQPGVRIAWPSSGSDTAAPRRRGGGVSRYL